MSLSLCTLSAQEELKFGIFADIQYANCDHSGARYYRNSLGKLEKCITELNREDIAFSLNLGDILDRNSEDVDSVLMRLERADKRVYNITGNHDYDGVTDNKSFYKKLSIPANGYYSFEKDGWIFVMMNTNELASYSNVQDEQKKEELLALQERLKQSKAVQGADWNGGVSQEQLAWLEKQLIKAEKRDKRVLISTHHPLYPTTPFSAHNNDEILLIIDKFSCVKAIFSGHHHSGGFYHYGEIPILVVPGMVETESENAFGVVTLSSNGEISIEGFGRVKSQKIE